VPLSARDASSDVGAVRLRGVSVCWGEKQALADCSVEAAPGELVFVLGAVGAGKSSLIQALAGTSTLRRNSERAETLLPSRVSLASQKPFLASGTVRENICFGLPFDEARYRAVLHACALEQDLAAWRLGDATLVSNNGENVSGGQRQRIAIARACYDNVSRCVVLDDPLSALDAATARHVLERCICGLLRGRTVIVASHAVSSARCADKVWFVDQGARAVCGTFDELMLALPAFRAFVSEHERGNSRESEAASAAMRGEEDGDDDAAGAKGGSGEERGNEPAPPRRDSFTTILLGYFRAARSSSLLACLFALFLFLQVLDFWGAAWLGLASSGTVSVGWGTFSGVYFGSVLLSALVLRLRSSAMATFCQRASATLYAAVMGSSRLQHGMPKHEAAEARELLAKDMQEVDLALPLLLENSAASFFAVLGIVCVTIAVTPFGVLAVAAALWALRAIHLTYGRVQRRLFFSERAARQDLATLVADTVLGRETVLSFGRRAYFERLFGEHVERLEALAAAGATTESWLHVRLSAISSAILCCGCVVLFLGTRGVLSYNRVSIAISFAYSITFTYYLAWLYKLGTLLHTKLFSVQMLNDFARDASQKRQDGDKKPLVSVQVDDVGAGGGPKPPAPSPPAAPLPHQPQPPTPKHDGGKARDLGVSFEDVWFAHREGSPMVLRGLSLACGYGERVALVGRSGAGKSSVLSCLAGMGVRVAGSVRVNGQELRARGAAGSVCFVPQETCIFSASVRFNLDPSGRASEAALWAALKATGLHASFASLDDHVLSEDAAVADASAKRPARVVVLSEGQKALLALTRAYLSGCRVLCLDEVCANVDTATALRVSELLRTLWSHAAVLSVAHRVDAVRGCTRFVALRNGRVAREGALAEPKQAHSQ
jgi:ABC-type multidrug transport system fused ATPase/permease subunit